MRNDNPLDPIASGGEASRQTIFKHGWIREEDPRRWAARASIPKSEPTYWGRCDGHKGIMGELFDSAQPGDLLIMRGYRSANTWFVGPDGELVGEEVPDAVRRTSGYRLTNFHSDRSVDELVDAARIGPRSASEIVPIVLSVALITALVIGGITSNPAQSALQNYYGVGVAAFCAAYWLPRFAKPSSAPAISRWWYITALALLLVGIASIVVF